MLATAARTATAVGLNEILHRVHPLAVRQYIDTGTYTWNPSPSSRCGQQQDQSHPEETPDDPRRRLT